MKRTLLLAALAALFLTIGTTIAPLSPAHAQQPQAWKTHQVYVPNSGTVACASYRTVDYDYTFDGKKLGVRNLNGNLGTIDVPASGQINKASLKSPSGTTLFFTGNVLTKQLIVSNDLNCAWKTEPVGQQATRQ